MIKFSSEQRCIMQEKLLQAIKDFEYRLKRYQVNFSISLGHSADDIDLELLASHIRFTDRYIVLDRNTCAVIFDCTNDETGIKAANNLLSHFQGHLFSTPLYTSIVTASNYDTSEKMIHDLFDLLEYTITHNMDKLVVDVSQVVTKTH